MLNLQTCGEWLAVGGCKRWKWGGDSEGGRERLEGEDEPELHGARQRERDEVREQQSPRP